MWLFILSTLKLSDAWVTCTTMFTDLQVELNQNFWLRRHGSFLIQHSAFSESTTCMASWVSQMEDPRCPRPPHTRDCQGRNTVIHPSDPKLEVGEAAHLKADFSKKEGFGSLCILKRIIVFKCLFLWLYFKETLYNLEVVGEGVTHKHLWSPSVCTSAWFKA